MMSCQGNSGCFICTIVLVTIYELVAGCTSDCIVIQSLSLASSLWVIFLYFLCFLASTSRKMCFSNWKTKIDEM